MKLVTTDGREWEGAILLGDEFDIQQRVSDGVPVFSRRGTTGGGGLGGHGSTHSSDGSDPVSILADQVVDFDDAVEEYLSGDVEVGGTFTANEGRLRVGVFGADLDYDFDPTTATYEPDETLGYAEHSVVANADVATSSYGEVSFASRRNATGVVSRTFSFGMQLADPATLSGRRFYIYDYQAASNPYRFQMDANGRVLLGGSFADGGSIPARLSLATHTSNTGGIAFGTDVFVFRSGSNALSVTGGLAVSLTVVATGLVQGSQLVSTVATGTAPLVVTSTTQVANLNAQYLGASGQDAAFFRSASNLNAGTVPSGRITGSYTGITAVGTLTSLTVSGTVSVGGVATFSANAVEPIQAKGGTADRVFIGFFADAADQATRSGYIGYPVVADRTMNMLNALGDIVLRTDAVGGVINFRFGSSTNRMQFSSTGLTLNGTLDVPSSVVNLRKRVNVGSQTVNDVLVVGDQSITVGHSLGSNVGVDIFADFNSSASALNYINRSTGTSAGLVMQFIMVTSTSTAKRAGQVGFAKSGALWTDATASTQDTLFFIKQTIDGTLTETFNIGLTGNATVVFGLTIGTNLTLTAPTTATTVGAAGGASALPATPVGYWVVSIAGTNRKIPFYNT